MSAAAHAEDVGLRPLRDCVVVVTPRSFGMHDERLRRELEQEVGEVRYRPGPLAAQELAEVVADALAQSDGSPARDVHDLLEQDGAARRFAEQGLSVA